MPSQAVILATEDHKIRLRGQPKEGEWLLNQKVNRSWFTLRLLYVGLRNKLRLPIDERYALPLSPYMTDKYTSEEVGRACDMDDCIDASSAYYRNKAGRENMKSTTNYTILILVSVTALAFLIIVLLLASRACSFGG